MLNVGGTLFATTKMTLVTNSAYFQSKYSDVWKSDNGGEESEEVLFIDQDPDIFRTLLSFMRLGKIHSKDVTSEVLLQAQFLGINKLLLAARFAAEEEDLLEERTALFEAAKGAGLLDVPRAIRKEYARWVCVYPSRYKTHDATMPYITRISLGSISEDDDDPSFWTSFLDGMNYLSRNGYDILERQLSKDLESISESQPVDLCFSKLIMPEEAQNLEGIILRSQSKQRILFRKEFASFCFDKTTHRTTAKVACGGRDARDVKIYSIRSNRDEREIGTAKIREHELHYDSASTDDLGAMTWLQGEGYTKRENALGKICSIILALDRPEGSANDDEISPMFFSRPARLED